MPYPSTGGGGGAGFQLFIQSDNNQGVYADSAARNTYFAANQSEVDRLARNEFLIIKLDDNGSGDVAYQQYTGAEGSYVPADWVDVTSLVQGERGLPGDAATVANLSPRTAPIKSATEEELVDSLMTQPSEDIVVVDGEIGFTRTTARIGDNLTLGEDGAAAILSDMIDGTRALSAGTLVNDDGSTGDNVVIRRDNLQAAVAQPMDNETQLGDWTAWVPVTADRIIKKLRLRFAQNATGVRLTMRQADDQTQIDGPILYRSHTDTVWNNGGGFSITSDPAGGPGSYEIELENSAKVLDEKFVYLVVEQNTQGTGAIEFRGATLDIEGITQFYAYLEQTFLTESRDVIALSDDIQELVSAKADKSNVLELDNTDAFTPDADYEPATKKYVDDNDVGYVFTSWGANLQNTGHYPIINGAANGPQVSGLGINASAQIPADGTIDVLTYYMDTGDNTTVFKIIKNGAVVHIFTCDAPYGRETGIGVSVTTGDNVAIEYDAGMKPAGSIYSMYIK
tara:strand:+ start:19757 stop:21286 length:1530 start_codon:yes stop_codon:yes gene_type:complete